MEIIFVEAKDNDCITRNGEIANKNEKIVYKNLDGNEIISIEKRDNQFKIIIDERYVNRVDPIL